MAGGITFVMLVEQASLADKRGDPFAPCPWLASVLRVNCQHQIDKSEQVYPPRSLTYGSARCIIAANGNRL